MNEQILRALMSGVNGSSFISIDTLTEVKLTGGKKNPFQGRVTKRVTGSSVMVFQNKNSNGYANMVQRRLAKEGKNPSQFQLSPRAWGHRIENTPFVEHNGKMYLEVIFFKAGDVEILVDGKPYMGLIEGMPDTPAEAFQGDLEDKVILRTYSTDSIKAITINKQRFEDKR